MKRFICMITLLCGLFALQYVSAQPPTRRAQQESRNTGPSLSVRAQTQYTGQIEVPEEVVWKREIYREIILNEEKNAALYYPVEPMGNRMNLFSLIFKLIAEGKVPAYEYRLDGTEDLTASNRTDLRDLLDRFHIYYEEEIQSRDTLLLVDNSDIPSAEVLSYYVKEDWYFDHRTSHYNSKIVALCPVMHRSDDFMTESTKYPMFWVNYNDISPYLGQMPIMTSNLNNIASISMDDYFTSRLFKGNIYKTTNMLNQTLSQYCDTDSALVAEQQRIEGQLQSFRNNLWESTKGTYQAPGPETTPALLAQQESVETVESIPVMESAGTTKGVVTNSKRKGRDKAENSSSATPKVKKESSSRSGSSSSGPRVSVRRERR